MEVVILLFFGISTGIALLHSAIEACWKKIKGLKINLFKIMAREGLILLGITIPTYLTIDNNISLYILFFGYPLYSIAKLLFWITKLFCNRIRNKIIKIAFLVISIQASFSFLFGLSIAFIGILKVLSG